MDDVIYRTKKCVLCTELYVCSYVPGDPCTLNKLADNTAHKKFITSGAN